MTRMMKWKVLNQDNGITLENGRRQLRKISKPWLQEKIRPLAQKVVDWSLILKMMVTSGLNS